MNWFIFAIPLLGYSCLYLKNRKFFSKPISTKSTQGERREREREMYQNLSITLAGFTFAIFSALIAFQSYVKGFENLVFFILASFTSFFIAYFIQRFRGRWLHDLWTDAFIDTGIFSLIVAVILTIWQTPFTASIKMLPLLGIGSWFLYWLLHLFYWRKFLREEASQNE